MVSFDMGGTSTDVALCDGGLEVSTGFKIGGLPVRTPMLDIHTVGAGGGSVATVDAGTGGSTITNTASISAANQADLGGANNTN